MQTKKKGQATLQVINCVRKPVPPGTKRRGPRSARGSEWYIPPILAQILSASLRRIQVLGVNRNPERCAIEAEHVQNLPPLLLELGFDPEVFDHYWNVERIVFTQKSSPDELAEFAPLWQDLAEFVETVKDERARGEA